MELRLVRRVTAGGVPVLEVTGEVDLATVPGFRDALHRLVVDHRRAVVAVDLDGVLAIDDTGLGLLLGSAARARESGGDLLLICTEGRLRRRLAATGLDRALEVRSSLSG